MRLFHSPQVKRKQRAWQKKQQRMLQHCQTRCFGILTAVLLICLVHAQGWAQDRLEPENKETVATRSDWGLSFTPYAWLAGQSTDVDGTQLRQSFNDLASITNIGFQGRMMVSWRKLFFAADWTYADLSSTTEVGRTAIDLELKQNILDMKFGALVYDSTTPEQDGGVEVWTGIGGRYWDNRVDFTITTQPILPGGSVTVDTANTGQSWWDPVLELGFRFPVTPTVGFVILATGGGFGIGDASDYMWDANFSALFQLSRRLTITAGYRVFKYDRTDGTGDEAVRQTVTVSGPIIGLRIEIF